MRTKSPTPDRPQFDHPRVRALPDPLAWAGHCLSGLLSDLTLGDISLLFFLQLGADPEGLSFWSDGAVAKRLCIKEGGLIPDRFGLLASGFITYRHLLCSHLTVQEERI